jgi:hypothetical protein
MKTGHVGAEYVSMSAPQKAYASVPPLRLGDPKLDAIALREPDMAIYDAPRRQEKVLDPGEPPSAPPTGSDTEKPDET